MPIAANFSSQLTVNWEIYFSQCYPNGALKIPELSNLLQLTAAAHADMGSVGFADLADYDQSWVMNRMRIEIDKLPVWSNNIEINTWVEELKGVKSVRDFEVIHQGKKYIGVSSLWAIFNMKTRRPDSLKIDTSHVERYPDRHATNFPNRKLSSDFVVTESYDYTVQFSDLDIVRHANNVKYLEWCLNHVNVDLILNNRIKAIDLNFIKELALEDKIIIAKGIDENRIFFKILKDDVVCFVCEFEIA
ncbi:acyl-[acyl-carrier-protein] thioesterase [Sphingobacterium rhinopitheci]|uniref:acyl-[acyl-carrier-protein] thioesterase n=1 Tax=Sphingobacterium rhinopitheci TaxID=2781960 RepID=UPI001F51C8BB|nr:acyl-ACP thioesterase domain-containing protein [Sphingobacterium rhinopitheci]MCI0921834.1 acyl-[acyl-carrier-protein] thioesterase [Sphingobacterium rhinopitheci]